MTLIVQVDDYDHKYLSADFAEDIGAKVEHLKFKSDLEISLKIIEFRNTGIQINS